MYSNNRDAYRQTFFDIWSKYQKQSLLEPLESQLLHIMLLHPEYHHLLEQSEQGLNQEFSLADNPFLHMSLHLAVHEQRQTNRPQGMTQLYQRLLDKYQDQHRVDHIIMECLTEMMSHAQQSGKAPSDEDYLKALRNL